MNSLYPEIDPRVMNVARVLAQHACVILDPINDPHMFHALTTNAKLIRQEIINECEETIRSHLKLNGDEMTSSAVEELEIILDKLRKMK